MNSRRHFFEIMDDEDAEDERVINICPTGDDPNKEDLSDSDDLSIMQQYYSGSIPSKSNANSKKATNKQRSSWIDKGQVDGYYGGDYLQNHSQKPNDSNMRNANGSFPIIASVQSLAANVDRPPSTSSNQLPPESIFNLTQSKNGPRGFEISPQAPPTHSGSQQTESLHRTDKNDNLIPMDNRRMTPTSRMDTRPMLPHPVALHSAAPRPPAFMERPDLHPAYGRPMFPYGYPYYAAPYFPPPAPPPMSNMSHSTPVPRMPGLVCRVQPPVDAVHNTPVFGIIQREKDNSGQMNTYFLCDFCQSKTKDQETFLNHVLTHTFVCSACGQQTFSRIQLISHIAKKHPDYFARLGPFETMQVAKLGVRPQKQTTETDTPITKVNEETPTPEKLPSPVAPVESDADGASTSSPVKGITVQEDGFTSCDLCKVTTESTDKVLWSAHVYLHQADSPVRIHCTLCGKFSSNPSEILEHFYMSHPEKKAGIAYAIQAVNENKLVYVWFCPHCNYSNESVAIVTEHLQEKHERSEEETVLSIKTALRMDVKESLLERTAGIHTSLDLQLPGLLNWTSTDGTAEPNPESFVHHTPISMQRSPERLADNSVDTTGKNLAALKSMYDNMIARTRLITDVIVAARDYYSKGNGVYSCRRCLYRTRHKHLVAEHLWHHLPGSKWACNYCTFTNKRRRNVVDHLKNKHKGLAPKLIVQVPTVIDFDNKPMNVQQLNVARKSTSKFFNRQGHVLESCALSTGSTQSFSSSKDPQMTPQGTTLRTVTEAFSSKNYPTPAATAPMKYSSYSPKKDSQLCLPKDAHSNSATPVLSSTNSQSSLVEMSRVRFPMHDDSSSCWVCNVCHRKDERWSVMRSHLMFAHPHLYSNECLALSHVKKREKDLETLVAEAKNGKQLLRPLLLSLEKVFMYPHLQQVMSNRDASAIRQKQSHNTEDADEKSNRAENDPVSQDNSMDGWEVVLLESDDNADEDRPSDNSVSNSPKKQTVAKKSTSASARVSNPSSPSKIHQRAKKSTSKRATSGVNNTVENGISLYGCIYCSREFADSLLAREHLSRLHHDKEPLVINLQQIHNPDVSRIFLCTSLKCSYSTFNEAKFKSHVMKHALEDRLDDVVIV